MIGRKEGVLNSKHICFEKAKKEAMQPSMTSFFVISMNYYLHISRMI